MVMEVDLEPDTMLDSVVNYGGKLATVVNKTTGDLPMPESKPGRGSLLAGGVAALLASACCLGPLVLVVLGFSGAWIGNLTALEPYRPWFLAAALVAMVFAWRQLYRPARACEPGDVCAAPRVHGAYKAAFWFVALLIAIAAVFPYVLPLFY
jgi:mercuric ion transport protein